MMRCTRTCAGTARDITLTLLDDQIKMQLDPYISQSLNTKKLADNTYSSYTRRKKLSMISPRDFSMITYIYEHQDESGDITIVQFSDPLADSYVMPEQKDITRGEMHL